MPWRRSFGSVTTGHAADVWYIELLVLQPGETLDSMWVGVQHRRGWRGPSFGEPSGSSVLMHGMVLVPPPPAPVPVPLSDPFEDWLMRDMAQWESDSAIWSMQDGAVGFWWSNHPTRKYEGRRRNDTSADLHLYLSVQSTPPAEADFTENMITRTHVEAFILP